MAGGQGKLLSWIMSKVKGISWNVNVCFGSFKLTCTKTESKEVAMARTPVDANQTMSVPSLLEVANILSRFQ